MRSRASGNVAREKWRGSLYKKKAVFLVSLSILVVFLSASLAVEQASQSKNIQLPKEAVYKKVLENGLTILAKKSAPEGLVSLDIKIKAGSSIEEEYLGSGISHLVEHMVFKGTAKRGPGDIEREVKSYGGFINGSVSGDLTDFHITIPSKYLSKSLSLLRDMLTNAKFDNAELVREKEVILKEIRLDKDEPQSQILRLLNETAYIRHTYKYPPIGYETIFNKLTRDDCIKYYDRMYVPNRMVITIVGGIEENDVIAEAEKEFKDFRPANYSVIGLSPEEPVQLDRRYREEDADTNLGYLAMGFHSTSLLNSDLFAMDVLAMILGRGDNSRLNVSLFKNKRIVHFISCWNYTPQDPGLFVVTAILDKENFDVAEQSVMEEIKKLKPDAVSNEELESARRMVLSDFIFSRQTIDAQANDISSNYMLTASYDFSSRYVEGIQAVSKDDVKRAANIYLKTDNLTTIRLIPKGSRGIKTEAQASTAPKKDSIKKVTLPNGLKLLIREDDKTPTVSIAVAMLGGLMAENKANNGISDLTARMLLKGTRTRSQGQIKGAIESSGGSISSFSGFNSFGLDVEILEPDLDFVLDMLKDILTDSIFPDEEIDKEKALTLAIITQEDDDIFQKGFNILRKEIFEPSPYSFRYLGEKDSIRALKREDILNFYKTYCLPNNMAISISGDVNSEALITKLKTIFRDLKEKEVPVFPSKNIRLNKIKARALEMDKEQSLVLFGFETTSIKDKDKYALDVMGSILSGYSGRLFAALRDKMPLAYSLGCVQKLSLDAGYLVFYVATTKDNIPTVKKGLVGEIKDIMQKMVKDEELVLAKKELCTKYEVGAQTNSFFSSNSAIDELYGLGYDNLYKYKEEIEKVTSQDVKRVAQKYLDLIAYAEVVISSK